MESGGSDSAKDVRVGIDAHQVDDELGSVVVTQFAERIRDMRVDLKFQAVMVP